MPQQVCVGVGIAVNAAPGLVDDPLVAEIGGQGVIICGKRPGATDNRQSQNVVIVRHAVPTRMKALFLLPEASGIDGSEASCSLQRHKLPTNVGVLRKLDPQFAGRH